MANPDAYTTIQGQTLTVNAANGVLANDTNADGNPLSAVLVDTTADGSLTLNSDGSFSYIPNAGFSGTDSFTYTATDGFATSAPATVTLTVYSVPVANNDSYTVVAGNTLSVSAPGVLGNDTNADNNPLTAALGTNVSHGSLTLNSDGSFSYTANAGFSGMDSFSYTAADGIASSTPATVTITVYSVPVANPDAYNVVDGSTLTVNATNGVLANDTNADNNPLTAALGTNVSHGTLVLNSNGSLTYMPTEGFSGTDTFTYTATDGIATSAPATVTLTVYSVPVANNDSYTVVAGNTLSVSAPGVLGNDTDADGGTLSATLGANVSHGALALSSNGSLTYMPTAGFSGTDTFTYTATDGIATSAPATVTITVYSVPVANPDIYPVVNGTTLTVSAANGVLANDTNVDGNPLTAVPASSPSHGQLTLHADGSFSYTPTVGYSGSDSFSYTATDGYATSSPATVIFTITAQIVANNDAYSLANYGTLSVAAPGVLGNDTTTGGLPLSAVPGTGPAHGQLTFNANGSFSYTPAAGYSGTDSFSYTASDGQATSNTATVTLNVTYLNPTPVANPDSYITGENTMLYGTSVLANDTVANPNVPITGAQLVTPPVLGTLFFNSDGTFTYIPPTWYVGTQTFTYTASNAVATSSPATVTITITNANLTPTAYAGTLTVTANTTAFGFLSALNPDGPIVFSIVQQGTLGTATITAPNTGAFSYTPTLGVTGTDTFVFSVAYAANPAVFSTATVTVSILGNAASGVIVTSNLPSPQVVGTPITYTATTTGIAGPLQYQFVSQYKLANGTWSSNTLIQDWSTNNQCSWTPASPNNYAVEAYVPRWAARWPIPTTAMSSTPSCRQT